MLLLVPIVLALLAAAAMIGLAWWTRSRRATGAPRFAPPPQPAAAPPRPSLVPGSVPPPGVPPPARSPAGIIADAFAGGRFIPIGAAPLPQLQPNVPTFTLVPLQPLPVDPPPSGGLVPLPPPPPGVDPTVDALAQLRAEGRTSILDRFR